MKRRLLWIGGTIVGLAILLTLVIWGARISLDRRFEDLSEQALVMEMHLDLPERPSNPAAERLRSEIDAFSQKPVPSLRADRSYFSEDPKDIELLRRHTASVLPKVFAFSNCKSFGKSDGMGLDLEAVECAEMLLVEGNSEILRKDSARVVEVGAAIRRIAHLHPSDTVSGAAILVLVVHIYADLLQRGADVARTEADLDLIVEEINRWQIVDFKKAAANLIAEEFLMIGEDAKIPIDTKSPIEFVTEIALRTEVGVLKEKISALRTGLEIFPQWSDDAKVWATIGRQDVSNSDVSFSAEFLKLSELDLRRKLASLWATLYSRRRQIQGGSWPSIRELEALGVEVRDPITGNIYEWREIDGKRRLYGKFRTYGDHITEEFLLASDGELERWRKSGK